MITSAFSFGFSFGFSSGKHFFLATIVSVSSGEKECFFGGQSLRFLRAGSELRSQ